MGALKRREYVPFLRPLNGSAEYYHLTGVYAEYPFAFVPFPIVGNGRNWAAIRRTKKGKKQ